MKGSPRRFQFFLVILISSFFAVFPAYLHYNYLVEADFPSPVPAFENLDQDYLLVSQQNKLIASGSSDSYGLRENDLLEYLADFDFQTSSAYQKTFNLRC
jgi:hypothetical protein